MPIDPKKAADSLQKHTENGLTGINTSLADRELPHDLYLINVNCEVLGLSPLSSCVHWFGLRSDARRGDRGEGRSSVVLQ